MVEIYTGAQYNQSWVLGFPGVQVVARFRSLIRIFRPQMGNQNLASCILARQHAALWDPLVRLQKLTDELEMLDSLDLVLVAPGDAGEAGLCLGHCAPVVLPVVLKKREKCVGTLNEQSLELHNCTLLW